MQAKKNKRERSSQIHQVSAGLRAVLGMTQWRKEHPKATFRELAAAGDERVNQVRAQVIEEGVQMGETEVWDQKPEGTRPKCATCGQPLGDARRTDALDPNDGWSSDQGDAHGGNRPGVGGRLFPPWTRSEGWWAAG